MVRIKSRRMQAIFAACVLTAIIGSFASPAVLAEEGLDKATPSQPIIVYTQTAAARVSGGPAELLLQKTRRQGQVRVIVGLRTTMRMEHTLSPLQARAQQQSLRRMQDAILARSVGSANEDLVVRFTFIPYMSVFVDAVQLTRLLNDSQVVSIQEDIPQPPALTDSREIINAPAVWAKGVNGTGQTVAILDTGVAKAHPMLAGKVKSEACYSTRNTPAGLHSVCPAGATAVTGPGTGVNCPVNVRGCDHGTHVASTAAGNSNLLDGIARDANIIAIQIFTRVTNAASCNPGTAPCALYFNTDLIKGLQRVFALRNTFKIAAANMSIGGALSAAACDASVPALATAINNLRNAGIAPIVAAGNNGSSTQVSTPACMSNAIAVGNTTKSDLVARSSNHNALIKLMAPGSDIKAAVPTGASCIKNGSPYCKKTGTSMAAPHVAGAFAMLKEAKPTATLNDLLAALTCSGKMVDKRNVAGTPELPQKPRIDLLGAYNFLKKPPNVARAWPFNNVNEAADWTPFNGTWGVAGGFYKPAALLQQWTSSAVADCNTRIDVTARMRRIDPSAAFNHDSGMIIKATLDYTNETTTGYGVFFNKSLDSTTNKRGVGRVFRINGFNLATNTGSANFVCSRFIPITVDGLNTLRVLSDGPAHSFFLNGQLICAFNDPFYLSGQVVVLAYALPGQPAGSFAVDTVTIKALGTGVAPSINEVMDPAAYAAQSVETTASLGGTTAR